MNRLYFQHHIFCCTNKREGTNARECCANKGAEKLRDYMKTRVKQLGIASTRVNNAGCLDRCELGPTLVIYPEGVWYRCSTKDDVEEVIQTHLIGGQIVERLRLPDA